MVFCSPAMSLGLPYSFPVASEIWSVSGCLSVCLSVCLSATHVHVELHAVALVAVDNGRHDDQHVLGDKVADASARVLVVAVARLDVELERLRADRQQQQQAAEPL